MTPKARAEALLPGRPGVISRHGPDAIPVGAPNRTRIGLGPSLPRRLAACIGLLLLLWGTGCAYKLHRQQSAHKAEQETRTSQIAASAESSKQSTAVEKKTGSKRTREFDPTSGKLVRDVLEQYQSDGKVVVEDVSASRSAAVASASRSAASASSSTTDAKTSAGLPWWLWLAGAAALVVGVWVLIRKLRPRIPFLG